MNNIIKSETKNLQISKRKEHGFSYLGYNKITKDYSPDEDTNEDYRKISEVFEAYTGIYFEGTITFYPAYAEHRKYETRPRKKITFTSRDLYREMYAYMDKYGIEARLALGKSELLMFPKECIKSFINDFMKEIQG